MPLTNNQLTVKALVIYNEVLKKANTAARVGQMFLDLITDKINIDAISTNMVTDAANNAKVPSVKTAKDYIDALIVPISQGAAVPGSVSLWGGTPASIPAGWLLGDGAAVSRITYDQLFAAIGVLYGVGNGTTTFNLPNMSQRVVAGYDAADVDYNATGKVGGLNSLTLAVNQLPKFRVKIFKEGDASSLNATWPGAPRAVARKNLSEGSNSEYRLDPASAGDANTGDSSEVGGDLPIDNRNKFIVLPYIIKF